MKTEFDVITRENQLRLTDDTSFVQTMLRRNLTIAEACRVLDKQCVVSVVSVNPSRIQSDAVANAVARFGKND